MVVYYSSPDLPVESQLHGFWPSLETLRCHHGSCWMLESKKDDKVAVPVCAQEHERYYPTSPHPQKGGGVTARKQER